MTGFWKTGEAARRVILLMGIVWLLLAVASLIVVATGGAA